MPPPPAPSLERPWSLSPVLPTGLPIALVQAWMAQDHVARWWQQAWSLSAWSDEVARQLAAAHSRPWLVSHDGRPLAYVESYRVARDVIAEHHPVGPYDLGVHIAVGEPAATGRGLGTALLRALADGLLAADPACERVLGDPAADHTAARRAFAAAGYRPLAEVALGHKRAALLAYDRAAARTTAPAATPEEGR